MPKLSKTKWNSKVVLMDKPLGSIQVYVTQDKDCLNQPLNTYTMQDVSVNGVRLTLNDTHKHPILSEIWDEAQIYLDNILD